MRRKQDLLPKFQTQQVSTASGADSLITLDICLPSKNSQAYVDSPLVIGEAHAPAQIAS